MAVQTSKLLAVSWLVHAVSEAAGAIALEEAAGHTPTLVERANTLRTFCKRAKAPPSADAAPSGKAPWVDAREAADEAKRRAADERAKRDLAAQMAARRGEQPPPLGPQDVGALAAGVIGRLKKVGGAT